MRRGSDADVLTTVPWQYGDWYGAVCCGACLGAELIECFAAESSAADMMDVDSGLEQQIDNVMKIEHEFAALKERIFKDQLSAVAQEVQSIKSGTEALPPSEVMRRVDESVRTKRPRDICCASLFASIHIFS